jgi:hypothetical protein
MMFDYLENVLIAIGSHKIQSSIVSNLFMHLECLNYFQPRIYGLINLAKTKAVSLAASKKQICWGEMGGTSNNNC